MTKKKKKAGLTVKMGPSLGSPLKNWLKLIFSNGFFVKLKYYPRLYLILIISTLGIPFRMFEHWKFRKRIKFTDINNPPIFILGHWRSGTTHLHNLLTQDPQFGYITMLEASFPKSFLITNFFKFFMKSFLPKKRPMDNMEMGLNFPQEEEMAISNLIPFSFYNALYFPEKLMENYYKYICLDQLSKKVLEKWQNAYLYLLKKTTLNVNGKQLVLKNPANTARISLLLKLFPNAKFIHIYRNPYVVFVSMKNFYETTIKQFMLQDVSISEIEKFILIIYKQMMEKYFREKKLIPKENLIEVKFEDLEKDPINILGRIYEHLKLKGFNNVRTLFEKYLLLLKNYKKNIYEFTKDKINLVKEYWKFTIKQWNYKFPIS
ncbi:MAG: sulfotransferase [Promethearchaeota archaeon]